jgi:hypothetical protein
VLRRTGVKAQVAKDPLFCVALGTGIALEHLDTYKKPSSQSDAVSQINSEAQQALLKLFEEPQAGTIFVVLAPHGSIISTLRSRFLEYSAAGASGRLSASTGSATKSARSLPNTTEPGPSRKRPGVKSVAEPVDAETLPQVFLKASVKSRSDTITKLLKDEEGLRERVRDFLGGLELQLHQALATSKDKREILVALQDISQIRSYANDRSPSLKMLLEHVALSLPSRV